HTPHEDLRGLDAEPLMVDPRVAVLPAEHVLARRTSLRWADLRDETLPRWPGRSADGATGPEVTDLAELKHLIVIGRTIAVLARSAVGQVGPELVCVPVRDAAPSTLVVAWPPNHSARHVAAFVRVATTVAARHHPGAETTRLS